MAEVTDTASVLPSHASGTSTPTRHPWLSGGPLYAFTLPPELLDILTLRSLTGQADNKGDDRKKAVEDDTAHSYEQTALGCNLCQVGTFESLPEQRAHFSSDWHRFNVKRKLDNKDPVAEDQWDNLVDCKHCECSTVYSLTVTWHQQDRLNFATEVTCSCRHTLIIPLCPIQPSVIL